MAAGRKKGNALGRRRSHGRPRGGHLRGVAGMTAILATTFSILAISGVAWAAKRMLRVPVCPICLGVGGTWLWMLIGRSLGYAVDATMLAILLGGSVAGIAYQLERRLPQGRSPLLWKILFIPPRSG